MRVSLTFLGLSIFEFEASTDDTDLEPDQSLRPPLGFAGSGSGLTELSDDRMLDTMDRTRTV